MKKITIEIETTNDSFFQVSDPKVEVGIILQGLIFLFENSEGDKIDKIIRDSNNEVCGKITIK